jgi:hypothetical protein
MKKLNIVILVAFGMLSCERPGDELPGRWDDRKGQIFEFNADGTALWIFYDDVGSDTFIISYSTDFTTDAKQLDLTGFKTGPLTGRTLYGIIEFRDNSSFRVDFEPSPSARPEKFDPEQTKTYYKIK